MSNLILGVLSSVAEFERSVISERTHLAYASAKAAGRHWGRDLDEDGPTRAEVADLRMDGLSWAAIARKLKCSESMARRRAEAPAA